MPTITVSDNVTPVTGTAAPAPAAKPAPAKGDALANAMARIAALEARNNALETQAQAHAQAAQTGIRIRVNAKGQPTGRHGAVGKGTISVFGIKGTGRWGMTYYPSGWVSLVEAFDAQDTPFGKALAQTMEKFRSVLDWGNTEG